MPMGCCRLLPGWVLVGLLVVGAPSLWAEDHATDSSTKLQGTSLLGQPLIAADPNAETVAKMEQARSDYLATPDDADAIIWYGRRIAYTGDYVSAIRVFTEGIEKFPNDARMYRHRGHRYISTRQLDKAIVDLEWASQLIAGQDNEIEPDGLPNAQGIPVSTLHGNIWYHLGLAYYLKHDWINARRAFLAGYATSTNDDNRVSTAHWLYMIHRRMGDMHGATASISEIHADMDVIENDAYYRLCLLYKGMLTMDDFDKSGEDNPSHAAIAYGLANWMFYNGDVVEAARRLQAILETNSWAAFGYIAAESDVNGLN